MSSQLLSFMFRISAKVDFVELPVHVSPPLVFCNSSYNDRYALVIVFVKVSSLFHTTGWILNFQQLAFMQK